MQAAQSRSPSVADPSDAISTPEQEALVESGISNNDNPGSKMIPVGKNIRRGIYDDTAYKSPPFAVSWPNESMGNGVATDRRADASLRFVSLLLSTQLQGPVMMECRL